MPLRFTIYFALLSLTGGAAAYEENNKHASPSDSDFSVGQNCESEIQCHPSRSMTTLRRPRRQSYLHLHPLPLHGHPRWPLTRRYRQYFYWYSSHFIFTFYKNSFRWSRAIADCRTVVSPPRPSPRIRRRPQRPVRGQLPRSRTTMTRCQDSPTCPDRTGSLTCRVS